VFHQVVGKQVRLNAKLCPRSKSPCVYGLPRLIHITTNLLYCVLLWKAQVRSKAALRFDSVALSNWFASEAGSAACPLLNLEKGSPSGQQFLRYGLQTFAGDRRTGILLWPVFLVLVGQAVLQAQRLRAESGGAGGEPACGCCGAGSCRWAAGCGSGGFGIPAGCFLGEGPKIS